MLTEELKTQTKTQEENERSFIQEFKQNIIQANSSGDTECRWDLWQLYYRVCNHNLIEADKNHAYFLMKGCNLLRRYLESEGFKVEVIWNNSKSDIAIVAKWEK